MQNAQLTFEDLTLINDLLSTTKEERYHKLKSKIIQKLLWKADRHQSLGKNIR